MIKKILEHNKKNNLVFYEKEHKYTIDDGIELRSVTTLLKKCFPFDAQKISKKVSEIRGVPQQELLDDWNETATNGSLIHSLAEKYCLGHKLKPEELEKIKHVIRFLEENKHFKILSVELPIFNRKHKVAGTIDLFTQNTADGDKLYLLDYKTCRKDINKKEDFQKALPPLQEFPHNKFYNYSCQLSVYAHILKEEYGIEIYNNYLVHLNPDGINYKLIEIEDMGMFVEEILDN